MLTGLSGASLSVSLKIYTAKDLEFKIDSTSLISVINDPSFKFAWCCFSKAVSIMHAYFYLLLPNYTIWLPKEGFFYHVTRLIPPFCRNCNIFFSFISERALCRSDLVPTKFVPLLHFISLVFPRSVTSPLGA